MNPHTHPRLQQPERLFLNQSTLCRLSLSRYYSTQSAKCLRPAGILLVLDGAGATTAPGSSSISPRRGKWSCRKGNTWKTAKQSAACSTLEG